MTVTYRGKEYPSEEFLPGVRDKMSTRSLVLAASHETIDYYGMKNSYQDMGADEFKGHFGFDLKSAEFKKNSATTIHKYLKEQKVKVSFAEVLNALI